ncbi:hypothetical protein [Taklimakanibacter lacteus]|uniref:hypothetical protein n=1 Tax=Taklimakanibacter lacteus TaxID=2268456 RepID=UPI0013C47983
MATLALAGVAGQQAAAHSCTCRANGQAFTQGQIVCIRGKLSQCQMNQNVPTWQIISDTCPEAELPGSVPVFAAISLPASPPLPPSH